MADIASGDVTYTLVKKLIGESGMRTNVMTVAFGDGALTYPSGGIPLTAGKLGCPNQILSLMIYSPASSNGYSYKYDAANNKIRIYQAPVQTHSHSLTLKNAAVADGATTRVNAGTNLLGANTGSDITIAGGGANGGVASATLAAAALSELASAPAATTLYIEAVGW